MFTTFNIDQVNDSDKNGISSYEGMNYSIKVFWMILGIKRYVADNYSGLFEIMYMQ